jgi:hypothetical protein
MECETRQHALREERRIFDERKELIVNKYRPVVSEDERKFLKKMNRTQEQTKIYRETHKDKIKASSKSYYESHREEILARQKAKYQSRQSHPATSEA